MNRFKSILKRRIPPGIRLLRYTVYDQCRYLPDLILSLGNRFVCPFCAWRFRRFLPAGSQSPLYSEVRVIPGGWRANVVCPRCRSNDRERLLYLYLRNKTGTFSGGARILHVAPEPCLRKVLLTHGRPAIYVTADLEMPNVDVRMDITRIPHPSSFFDLIICNHVLEHVPDDGGALRELFRILRPGGWAILQVPIAPDLTATIDGPAIRSPEERLKRFGQKDHVRLYAWDYLDRLRAAGFQAGYYDFIRDLDPALVERYALLADEKLVIARK